MPKGPEAAQGGGEYKVGQDSASSTPVLEPSLCLEGRTKSCHFVVSDAEISTATSKHITVDRIQAPETDLERTKFIQKQCEELQESFETLQAFYIEKSYALEQIIEREKRVATKSGSDPGSLMSEAQKQADVKKSIIDVHSAMSTDFKCKILKRIEKEAYNAEFAIQLVCEEWAEKMASSTLTSFSGAAERRLDMLDIKEKWLRAHLNLPVEGSLFHNIPRNKPVILVLDDLAPSEVCTIPEDIDVRAIVLETNRMGGHINQVAEGLGIHVIHGVKDAVKEFKPYDGNEGLVFHGKNTGDNAVIIPKPTREEIEQARLGITETPARLHMPITRDGVRMRIGLAGITDREAYRVHDLGADGMDLQKTEFIVQKNGKFLSEDDQYQVFLNIARANPGVTTFRTFDFGIDKRLPADVARKYKIELDVKRPYKNRGLDLALRMNEEFRDHLRAMFRVADTYGQVKIAFPMVLSGEQLDQALEVLKEIESELLDRTRRGPKDPRGIKTAVLANRRVLKGPMMEIPLSSQQAYEIVKRCDFAMIGSRDMVNNCHIEHHGGLLKALAHLQRQSSNKDKKITIRDVINGNKDIWPSMAPFALGNLANIYDGVARARSETGLEIPLVVAGKQVEDRASIAYLIGSGITDIAISPDVIAKLNHFICHVDIPECRELALKSRSMLSAKQVREMYKEYLKLVEQRNLDDQQF